MSSRSNGDTTTGIRGEISKESSPIKVAPVGQPIDAGKSPGSPGKGGGYVAVGADPFGAPKPGRAAGD